MLAKGLKPISLMTKAVRSFAFEWQTAIPQFDDLHKLNAHLDATRPSIYCMLATNDWSPL
jgi:hypothetical protein